MYIFQIFRKKRGDLGNNILLCGGIVNAHGRQIKRPVILLPMGDDALVFQVPVNILFQLGHIIAAAFFIQGDDKCKMDSLSPVKCFDFRSAQGMEIV